MNWGLSHLEPGVLPTASFFQYGLVAFFGRVVAWPGVPSGGVFLCIYLFPLSTRARSGKLI